MVSRRAVELQTDDWVLRRSSEAVAVPTVRLQPSSLRDNPIGRRYRAAAGMFVRSGSRQRSDPPEGQPDRLLL